MPSTSIPYLILLVVEAVLEVVCISLPGYIFARLGMFSPEMQKFSTNLNITVFTPCLIFIKLASQLTVKKLAELAVIPVIFIVMTLTSYLCSLLTAKLFRFGKRGTNFVIAMGVFGNSNSLPISLVMSLSVTLSSLQWSHLPGDNATDVGARGILYLLIFQQLGQVVRWSWGYHVLLGPRGESEEYDDGTPAKEGNRDHCDVENGQGIMQDLGQETSKKAKDTVDEAPQVTEVCQPDSETIQYPTRPYCPDRLLTAVSTTTTLMASEECRPQTQDSIAPLAPLSQCPGLTDNPASSPAALAPHNPDEKSPTSAEKPPSRAKKIWQRVTKVAMKVYTKFMAFMNPPLWAMLVSIIVASVPPLKNVFFTPGTIVENSITRAITQMANVAVPMILVVLGASLGNNGVPTDSPPSVRANRQNKKLLIASMLSRMVLPFIIMAPLLAVAAKFVPISILGDPIFVVVCYLLVGAPSALQLAQICQINGVYETVIAKLMFWSYVVVILPSTVVLVVTAVQVVGWAGTK